MTTCLACKCSPTARSALVEQARAQKRQRLAFSALAKAVQASSKAPAKASAAAAKGWGVSVSRPGRIGGDSSSIWLACTAEELSTLERCVAEAAAAVEEAGDFAMLMVQECDLGDDCMLIAF